eukprot:4252348-Ditylum_brightwellii.AAC.1
MHGNKKFLIFTKSDKAIELETFPKKAPEIQDSCAHFFPSPRDITYVLQPDSSADPGASSTQAATYISTTHSLNKNGTCVIGSPKFGFGLPLWLTI